MLTTMIIYACVSENDTVQMLGRDEPGDGVGPMDVRDLVEHYTIVQIIPTPVPRPRDLSQTAALYWNEGQMEWRETLGLGNLKLVSLALVDGIIDVARARILAAPTNSEEYRPTAEQAAVFKAAGYTGPVPPGVATWTHAKRRQGWTNQQACDDILATAAAWTGLLWFLRGLRLDTKELLRDATTIHEVELLMEVFHSSLQTALGNLPA